MFGTGDVFGPSRSLYDKNKTKVPYSCYMGTLL